MKAYGEVEALSNGIKPRYRVSYVEGTERIAFAAVDTEELMATAITQLHKHTRRDIRVWDTFLGKEITA